MLLKNLVIVCGLGLAGCTLTDNMAIKPLETKLQPAKTLEEILQQSSIQSALATFDAAKGHKVLAISEDGIWGLVQNANSLEWARWKAMRDCSRNLDVRNRNNTIPARGCFVYRLDDQVFTQPTDKLSTVVSKESRKMPLYSFDLGESTATAFARHQSEDQDHKAFAVSPGGGWGYSHAYGHPDDAADRAVKICDSNISLSDSVCTLYALDGTVVQR